MVPSPEKFVKPADLFKMRRKSKIEPQSPMKCLNNLTDPSPTKKLPTLLRNPFNQLVKRKLQMGNSPMKRAAASPRKSPVKRTRMLQLDEDANLEAPRMKLSKLKRQSPSKRSLIDNGLCYNNDWTLRTKLRINFQAHCKNWDQSKTTTHKRHSGNMSDEDSPSKQNDKTISIEAIKNAATVYQHPYLSWLPLYPRNSSESDRKKDTFLLTRHSQATQSMHRDWCESLDDLTNLLLDGRCPFFYLCSDMYNILFRHDKPTRVQAYISPISYGMNKELERIGVVLKMDEDSGIGTDLSSVEDFPDMGEDEDFGDDENDDTTQILESLGISQQELPSLQSKRKGFIETDSNSQSTKSISNRPLATIEGADDIKRLVKFLQTNRTYTITPVGEFACIPPTLLAPREFRLSTPQYPEVILSKSKSHPSGYGTGGGVGSGGGGDGNGGLVGSQMMSISTNISATITLDAPPTPPKENDVQARISGSTGVNGQPIEVGPTFVELKGTILPSLYKKLHKLLTVSDNLEHTCSSIHLDSSSPFGTIHFS